MSLFANKMFLSVLITWGIKRAAIGYDGPRFYRRLRPLFLGLIIGEWSPIIAIAAREIACQG